MEKSLPPAAAGTSVMEPPTPSRSARFPIPLRNWTVRLVPEPAGHSEEISPRMGWSQRPSLSMQLSLASIVSATVKSTTWLSAASTVVEPNTRLPTVPPDISTSESSWISSKLCAVSAASKSRKRSRNDCSLCLPRSAWATLITQNHNRPTKNLLAPSPAKILPLAG